MIYKKRNIIKYFKHKDIYREYVSEVGRLSTAKYAAIFGFSRQNINQRFNKDSILTKEEQGLLVQYLESILSESAG